MSREYPRFIFSNPKNTKSKGPFIVHLLKPRFICRLVNDNKEDIHLLKTYYKNISGWTIELLELFDDATSQKVSDIMDDMLVWASKQNEIVDSYKP